MNNDYQHVLKRLKEEREQRNLPQRLLCYCMRMHQSHYSKAETGHRRFSYQEMKGLCTSDVDVLYIFTGKKPKSERELPVSPAAGPDELICCLNIVYTLTNTAWFLNRNNASFEKIQKQLEYIQYKTGNNKTKNNVFLSVRNRCGYTQKKMSDVLGVDIKKLRELEKGRLLPDSEIIWKMYNLFQISPAFILKDPKGLWRELNYVLELLADNDREIILHILENMHRLLGSNVK